MHRQLFLDADNFLFDFSGGFVRRFGFKEDGLEKKEMWRLIYSVPDFFSTLEFMPGAEEFYWSVSHKKPIILTAVPVSNVEMATRQKRELVRKRLGHRVLMIPAAGVPKSTFMFNKGDILADDYGKNCIEWEAAGGVAIKHENWGLTSQRLFEEFMR